MWNPSLPPLLPLSRSDYRCRLTDKERDSGSPSSPTCPYSANAHSPWTLQFLTEGQSSSGGFVFQNTSLASLLLPKAHSRQQGTQEQEDEEEVKKEGRETHLTLETMQQQQHDTPLPLSEQWRYTEWLCIRSIAAACVCVSANQHCRVLLVTIAALREALHSTVPW